MAKAIAYYRNKADRALQEWGRRKYTKCLVCKKPVSCLHHYYPKSTSSSLRYYEPNLIPICNGCHFSHHNGNPAIQNKINEVMGDAWLKDLRSKKNKIIKISIGYYKKIIEEYENKDR